MDGKDNNIAEVYHQLKVTKEECDDKQLVIDTLQQSMLRHEDESAMMASALSNMKQVMMDNETGFGLEKKFGCVKLATLRSIPCTM